MVRASADAERVQLLVILAVGLRPLDLARAPILRGPGAHGLTAMARSGSMTTAE
jgi:hypothetical protein